MQGLILDLQLQPSQSIDMFLLLWISKMVVPTQVRDHPDCNPLGNHETCWSKCRPWPKEVTCSAKVPLYKPALVGNQVLREKDRIIFILGMNWHCKSGWAWNMVGICTRYLVLCTIWLTRRGGAPIAAIATLARAWATVFISIPSSKIIENAYKSPKCVFLSEWNGSFEERQLKTPPPKKKKRLYN